MNLVDGNGYLDKEEITAVVTAMIYLFGADMNYKDADDLAEQCMQALATKNENMISKGRKYFPKLINFHFEPSFQENL